MCGFFGPGGRHKKKCAGAGPHVPACLGAPLGSGRQTRTPLQPGTIAYGHTQPCPCLPLGLLPKHVNVIGYARSKMSSEAFRQSICKHFNVDAYGDHALQVSWSTPGVVKGARNLWGVSSVVACPGGGGNGHQRAPSSGPTLVYTTTTRWLMVPSNGQGIFSL